jgi:hypothetical protein
MNTFDTLKMPRDLDKDGRAKWHEIMQIADLESLDAELLGNYCRTHSNLIAVRREKKIQQTTKTFRTMVIAKNGATVLHPLIVAESRLMQAGGRMLLQLGLSGNGKRQEQIRKPSKNPPPGLHGIEPTYGWEIEEKLCRDVSPRGKQWRQ